MYVSVAYQDITVEAEYYNAVRKYNQPLSEAQMHKLI